MRDMKVPQPALYTETFEKTRRNTLIWSGLSIATQLAQSNTYQIKSSVLGGDVQLPALMVSFIFAVLSAFHLYAFWFEKKRIEVWHNSNVSDHNAENISTRIGKLYNDIQHSVFAVNSYAAERLGFPHQSIEFAKSLKSEVDGVNATFAKIRNRDNEVANLLHASELSSEDKIKQLLTLTNVLDPYRSIIYFDFDSHITQLEEFGNALATDVRGTPELHEKLDKVTAQLMQLAHDIDTKEQQHFRWYEVGVPITAFGIATVLWVASLRWPDLPLRFRAMFW